MIASRWLRTAAISVGKRDLWMPERLFKPLSQELSILGYDQCCWFTLQILHQEVAARSHRHDQHRCRTPHPRPDAVGEATHGHIVTVTKPVAVLTCLPILVRHASEPARVLVPALHERHPEPGRVHLKWRPDGESECLSLNHSHVQGSA